jgi:hypothetical protein
MSITLIIIVVTVIASCTPSGNDAVKQKLDAEPYAVKRNNEYFRFITSGADAPGLHALVFHMLASLYSFWPTL